MGGSGRRCCLAGSLLQGKPGSHLGQSVLALIFRGAGPLGAAAKPAGL